MIVRRKLLIIATASLVAIGQQHSAYAKHSSAMQISHGPKLLAAKNIDGFAPIRIKIQDNFGYLVEPDPSFFEESSIPDNCCLVSIDGCSLLNKSWPEIKLLLAGPVDSTVVLELITTNGELIKRSLARTLNHTQDQRRITPIQFAEKLRAIDQRTCANWNSGEIDQNLDIFAKASSRQAMERALRFIPSPEDSNLVVTTALAAMIDMQEAGELESADSYLKIIQHDKAKTKKETFKHDDLLLAVSNLSYSGREPEALQLATTFLDAQDWHEVSPVDSWDSYYRVKFLREVTQLDSATSNSKVQALAKQIQSQYLSTPAHLTWLGKYFERSNQSAIAEAFYRGQSVSWLKKIEQSSALKLEDLQIATEVLYCRAQLAAKSGNYSSASTILKSALKLITERTSEVKQQQLNNLPLYFPKPKEIVLALSRVQKQQTMPAVPTLATEQTAKEVFKIVASFYQALSARNFEKAQKSSNALLQYYLAQPQFVAANQGWGGYSREHSLRTRQNLYLINLSMARKMADLGKFQASSNIIAKLQRSLPSKQSWPDSIKAQGLFLNAELVFNQAQQRKQGKTYNSKSSVEPLRWQSPLRLLAMSYHYAGERSRAQYFIESALTQVQKKVEHTGNTRAKLAAPDRELSLLHLDSACIYAANQKTLLSERHFERSMNLCQSLSEDLVATAVELAYIYKDQSRAEKSLAVVEKLETKVKRPTDSVLLKKAYLLLAEIHFEKHNWTLALEAALKAIACKTLYSTEPYYIAGRSAEKLGDIAVAVHYYFEAPGYRESGLPTSDPSAVTFLAEAALSAKDNPITRKQDELIASLLKEAESDPSDSYGALVFSQQALALMRRDDAARPALLLRICKLKATMDSSPQIIKENILLAKEAAELASKKHLPDASKYWLSLACYEAQLGHVEAATQHGKMAISLYDKTDPAFLHIQQVLPAFGLTYLLKKNGGSAQAEQLLQEAVERVNSIAGEGSIEAQAQMACQFEYYLQDKNFSKANQILKKILSCNCCQKHTPVPPLVEADYITSEQILGKIRFALIESVRSTDCEFAQQALKQILTKQETETPQGSLQLAKTWEAIAETYARAENTTSAYAAYQMQISQLLKLHPNLHKANFYSNEYIELLNTMHKQEERDAIEQERASAVAKFAAEEKLEREKKEISDKAKLEAQNKAVKW